VAEAGFSVLGCRRSSGRVSGVREKAPMDRAELKQIAKRIASKVSLKLVSPFIKPAIEAIIEWNARNIPLVRQLRAIETTVDFVNAHMLEVQSFPDHVALFDHVLLMVKPGPGLVCEFGVFEGRTINHIASKLEQTVYGFDSFDGLPEDWLDGLPRGTFKLDTLPAVAANVTLIKGWFDQTLAPFLASHPGDALLLHVDSDLYSSAKTVLDAFAPRIKAGTIIVFDEYFNFPGWEFHEFKAFGESASKYGWRYKYLGYGSRSQQVAVLITDVLTPDIGA
jgi:hypothetical protein